ncbi:hypothetical protein VP01_236g9 [Puccinia sorghi]|uniref:Acid phosphatase n=1 Tax=Puccinia sorghi TaxID=27349 RepID=A0A0L6V7T9_9BASI|nr:hypothetical protein VP01_236g9 [Puccinia sorghi]
MDLEKLPVYQLISNNESHQERFKHGSTPSEDPPARATSNEVGYQGPTEIGVEPFAAFNSPTPPDQQSYFPLVSPLQVSNDVHLLHRHGARYPTSSKEPAGFATRLQAAGNYKASGHLEFLNTWKYGLGKEVLTPFGRSQLFNLGVGFRQKYGHLLGEISDSKEKLVFRTTSQHRMLHSALNFAAESIIIEGPGFNNTLAPYHTCKKGEHVSKTVVNEIISNWTEIYLAEALPRLQANLTGYQLTFDDVVSMQKVTSALVASDPPELKFMFWYAYSFGSPSAAAIGKGWVEELVSRLTQEPIQQYDSSTNSTLDSNPITFPLNQKIYVDATHDTVISCIVVALNLTSLASEGPLPTRSMPKKQSFVSAHISPFAGNLQAQIVDCEGGKKMRFLLNDAPVPLSGLQGCPEDSQGFCPLSTAVAALEARIKEIDYQHDCNTDYSYTPPFGGGGIVDGRPPSH